VRHTSHLHFKRFSFIIDLSRLSQAPVVIAFSYRRYWGTTEQPMIQEYEVQQLGKEICPLRHVQHPGDEGSPTDKSISWMT
jgi:hypothetical protein